MEIWKDIVRYEGIYQVSNFGNVRNIKHNLILKQQSNKDGYMNVTIGYKEAKKTFLVHRLVTIHFLDNPECLLEVNHKDLNVKNNHVANLEWCTREYNVNYLGAHDKAVEKVKKKVKQLDADGNIIKLFNSIKEAAIEANIQDTRISACCRNKPYRKTAGGFIWKYA